MKVHVVVGVWRGCIEDVEVFSDEEKAKKRKAEIDQEYGHNTNENDSTLVELAVKE